MYVIAIDYRRRGVAAGGVVGTLMTNLGLEQALARAGSRSRARRSATATCSSRCRSARWQLGGENSGHIICLDKHTTGDAIVAALAVLRALIEQKTTLAAATAAVKLFPQRLINVPVHRGFDWKTSSTVRDAEQAAIAALGEAGRVLLRPSGTEPVLRVMVEAREAALAESHAQALAETIAGVAGQRL